MIVLDEVEVRVLASLIEKAITTPEYYPMTLNALVNACNQKNNREPVVTYDTIIVSDALLRLKDKALVRVMMGGDSRVPKYRHYFEEAFDVSLPQTAVLAVMMLRGPQTIGELRGRTDRFYAFSGIDEVEATLESLIQRAEPQVIAVPRQPGQKDARYMHLLAGVPEYTDTASAAELVRPHDRIRNLEEEISRLRSELEELQEEFRVFKDQFE